ncbi:MAG: hypothetical protein E7580_06815 [Ruminococcaceae bacterium]|nr:hypothetical protein [Oscillospiraceae bacterium]
MRILSLLLVFASLLSLFSCSKGLSLAETVTADAIGQSKSSEKDVQTEVFEYPAVCDKLSLQRINSFPVVSSEMTERELRQLCVDFFAYCQSFAWTPSEDYTYTVESKDRETVLKQGEVYGGLPYVTGGRGNIYRLMEYYNEETGVVNVKLAGSNPLDFGNQCSFGAFWAWARVVNSASFGGTGHMVAKNGFLPVGSYQYDLSISEFGNPTTVDICHENGEQTMFRAYAELEIADGLVRSDGAGHVIMCASEPVVVKNADGTINGKESYFTYIHQASVWSDQKQSDGSSFRAQTVPYTKKSFAETVKENYLPFTFAEFTGADPVEKSETVFTHTESTMTVAQMKEAVIVSNYAISDAYLTVTDEKGAVLLTKTVHPEKIDQKSLCLGTGLYPAELNKLAAENRIITVTCRIGTGETPTVYKGTLVS